MLLDMLLCLVHRAVSAAVIDNNNLIRERSTLSVPSPLQVPSNCKGSTVSKKEKLQGHPRHKSHQQGVVLNRFTWVHIGMLDP